MLVGGDVAWEWFDTPLLSGFFFGSAWDIGCIVCTYVGSCEIFVDWSAWAQFTTCTLSERIAIAAYLHQ